MFCLLELGLGDTVVYDTGTDPDVSGMVPDLQASYCNTAIELAVDRQITHGSAVVAAFGFLQESNQFHRFDFRSTC